MKWNFKKHLLVLAIVLCSFKVSWSQEYSPHGLGVGINGAVTSYGSGLNVENEALGVHFDHQRNWAKFFSFRTSIEANYFLPEKDLYTSSNFGVASEIETISQRLNTTIDLEPMFYLRTNAASFYVGLGLVAGDHTYFSTRTIRRVDGVENIYRNKESYFIGGIKPSIGVTFHMRDNSDDIDFQFSRNIWGGFEDVIDGDLFEYGEYMYVLTIAYRFNFQEG